MNAPTRRHTTEEPTPRLVEEARRCTRRAAELFEMLGDDQAAAICWHLAAAIGDPDAQDYAAAFYPAPTDPSEADPLLDVGGYLHCGCHGSQREHTCGPLD